LLSNNRDVDLKLYSESQINNCKNNSSEVIVLSIGKIEKSDSLFGCNVEIQYDTNDFKINNLLKYNTLGENANYSTFSVEKGIIRIAYVYTSMNPVFGDKPVCAFSVKNLNACEKNSNFKVTTFELTEEFQPKVNIKDNYIVEIKNIKAINDTISIVPEFDSLDLSKKQSINLKIQKNDNIILKNRNIDVSINYNNIAPSEIQTISESAKIIDLIKDEKAKEINFTLQLASTFISSNVLNLQFETKANIKDSVIITYNIDNCECLEKKENKCIYIYSSTDAKKEESTFTRRIINHEDYIEIKNNIDIENIKIFDIFGNMIEEIKTDKVENIDIKKDKLKVGAYLVQITSKNKIENTLIINE
jgi:hypothetical protein